MKRFYTRAQGVAADGGFGVALDGKRLRTPANAPLVLPTQALADALAAEWDTQAGEIQPLSMPLMRLVSTALDRVAHQRDDVVAEIVGYAGTDLVCYRASEPAALVARQQALWEPLVEWMRERYDVALTLTTGISPVRQADRVVGALRAVVTSHPTMELTGLHALTTAAGSLVVGLAALEGRLGPAGVWAAAQVEENFQIEQWGEPPEAHRRRQALREDIEASCRFVALLRA